MPLVLGVMGIPKVEVELLKIIVRLSSNLRSLWTVSDSDACDVLLVDGGHAGDARHMPAAPLVMVPVVARSEAGAVAHAGGLTLSRPIFAEELVDLLNQITPRLRAARTAAIQVHALAAAPRAARSGRGRASLTRWPAQVTMQKNPVYLRLAAALSKSAQSAESLSALSRVDVDECSTFMGLLEQEGVLAWSPDAVARDMLAGNSAQQRTGLLSRIRRRLGLA